MKKIFTLIALCLGISTGMWAAEGDVTTNLDIDFSNAIVTNGTSPKYSIAGTVGSLNWDNQWTVTPSIVDGILRFGNFTGVAQLENNNIKSKDKVTISFELAFGKLSNKNVAFELRDTKGATILKQQFDAYNGDFDDLNPLNLDWAGMYRGSNTVIQERCVYFTIVVDYATMKINTHTKCYLSGASKAATEKDFVADMPSSNAIGAFVVSGNTNNGDRYSTIDNIKITTTEGNYTSATANYIVKYVCGGEEIKTADTRTGDVDATVALPASDKENFYSEGSKYVYVSDDASSASIAADGSTVVTVTFREAAKYNWSVVSNIETAIASGVAFEDENFTIACPRYINVDGTLYETTKNGNDWYHYTYTATSDNQVETINYTATGITNVVFYTEAENLAGAVSGNGNSSRTSNGLTAYGTDLAVTNLAAGKYVIYVHGANGNSSDRKATFKNGETAISELVIAKSNNNQDIVSEEITLTEAADITLTSEGSSASGIDFFYIVKTGEYVAPKNTIYPGKYIAQVTVEEAEGITAPAGFGQYLGTHKYGMDLNGNEEELTISGLDVLSNLSIVADGIAYDSSKTFTLNGKEFTICSADGTKSEGVLAITETEDGVYTIENFGFKKAGMLVGVAKDVVAVLQVNKETEANITFEDIDLGEATFYNGADASGNIATDQENFYFLNYYDTQYGSWNGFAVSATRGDNFSGSWKDDTQYNSCVAGGMESAQFAIGYYSEFNALMDDQFPEIIGLDHLKPEYVYITNTAWAYKSMMNGDNMAKKFDETDWLKLTIVGLDEDGEAQTGSVDFYLAKDGNIVNEWTKVDLTPLKVCNSIRFIMDSSDKSSGFINTPCYFALDNMKVALTTEDITTAIADVAVSKANLKAGKMIKDGKLFILKNGVKYNVSGAQMK